MKTIATLIDFTPTCNKTVEFASKIAAQLNAKLVLTHIAATGEESQDPDLISKMDSYLKLIPAGVKVETQIDHGSFYHTVPHTIHNLEADIIVIGTHGKKGFKQNLLGSNILKLIQSFNIPSLVVQDQSEYSENTFRKLLLPTAPHENFQVKLDQITPLAKAFNSTVYIISIQKQLLSINEDVLENIEKSKAHFKANGIKYEVIKEEAQEFSIGYAKQIIKSAETNDMGTICIVSKVSKNNSSFGTVDKENFLLNKNAAPIFCANIA